MLDSYYFYEILECSCNESYGILISPEEILQERIDSIIKSFNGEEFIEWQLDDIVDVLNNEGVNCQIVSSDRLYI